MMNSLPSWLSSTARQTTAALQSLRGTEAVKWLVEAYHNVVAAHEPFAQCATAAECIQRVMAMNSLEAVGLVTVVGLTGGLIVTAAKAACGWAKRS